MINDLTLQGVVDEVSWRAQPDMTYLEWEAEGRKFQSMSESLNWWIGDWLNEGERRYGETYTQAIAVTGHKLDQLTVCKYVASHVRRAVRVAGLSWTHHRYVAHLDEAAQQSLLAAAARLNLSSRELQEAVDDYEAALDGPAEEIPFSFAPNNSLYNAELRDTDDAPVPVIQCLGVWEYAATDADGYDCYRLRDVATPGLMWLEYRDGQPLIKIRKGEPNDAAVPHNPVGVGGNHGGIHEF